MRPSSPPYALRAESIDDFEARLLREGTPLDRVQSLLDLEVERRLSFWRRHKRINHRLRRTIEGGNHLEAATTYAVRLDVRQTAHWLAFGLSVWTGGSLDRAPRNPEEWLAREAPGYLSAVLRAHQPNPFRF